MRDVGKVQGIRGCWKGGKWKCGDIVIVQHFVDKWRFILHSMALSQKTRVDVYSGSCSITLRA